MIKQEIPLASHVECSYPDASSIRFQIYNDCNLVAHFTMSFLYGCKGILISHGMLVSPQYRGRGIAKKLQPVKDKVARDLKVSVLLATVKEDNIAEKKVIKDWEPLTTFNNIRTGNDIGIHIKRIKHETPEEITIDACGNDVAGLVIDIQAQTKQCQDYSS